jgi:hypothetical protein
MIPTLDYIQNGFVFVSWFAFGWILGAVITAVAIKSINNK